MAAPVSNLATAMVTTPVPPAHWLAILPVALCISLGALLLMLRSLPRLQAWIAIAGLAVLLFLDAALLRQVVEHGPLTMVMGRWLPPFGIAFTVDVFSALRALAAAVAALSAGI